MLNQWLYIAIFVAISILLPTIAILLARILSPKNRIT